MGDSSHPFLYLIFVHQAGRDSEAVSSSLQLTSTEEKGKIPEVTLTAAERAVFNASAPSSAYACPKCEETLLLNCPGGRLNIFMRIMQQTLSMANGRNPILEIHIFKC